MRRPRPGVAAIDDLGVKIMGGQRAFLADAFNDGRAARFVRHGFVPAGVQDAVAMADELALPVGQVLHRHDTGVVGKMFEYLA